MVKDKRGKGGQIYGGESKLGLGDEHTMDYTDVIKLTLYNVIKQCYSNKYFFFKELISQSNHSVWGEGEGSL